MTTPYLKVIIDAIYMATLIETGVQTQRIDEILHPFFEVSLIPEEEFDAYMPSLKRFQSLVYARFTSDGKPIKVLSAKKENPIEAHYVIATAYDLSDHFSAEIDHRRVSEDIQNELKNYPHLAGFFRVEQGIVTEDNLPIEAMTLLRWNGWPLNTPISYCSQFSPNPLLSRDASLNVLTRLFSEASNYVKAQNSENNMFVILNNMVRSFVQEAGIETVHAPEAELNWDNEISREVFTSFPKYWVTEPPPQLYRFVPFSSS